MSKKIGIERSGTFDSRRCNPRIAISFEKDLFRRIDRLARAHKISFAAQVRALVARGFSASENRSA